MPAAELGSRFLSRSITWYRLRHRRINFLAIFNVETQDEHRIMASRSSRLQDKSYRIVPEISWLLRKCFTADISHPLPSRVRFSLLIGLRYLTSNEHHATGIYVSMFPIRLCALLIRGDLFSVGRSHRLPLRSAFLIAASPVYEAHAQAIRS